MATRQYPKPTMWKDMKIAMLEKDLKMHGDRLIFFDIQNPMLISERIKELSAMKLIDPTGDY